VIRNYDALEVRLHDGTTYDSYREDGAVELVGVDEDTDLAVLRIGGGNLQDLPWLQFADSDKVRVGEWVLAVGAPFNFDYSVTVGVVSQKGRYNVRMNTYESYIQTDASINPGNSGGPLLDLYGKVVGINDVIVTGGGMARGNIGLGFAISSNLVKQVVDQIIASGAVIRPWLGIAMQELTPELQQQFGAESGVLVSDVTPGDPAAEAGLKAGDVIVQVGEKAVQTPHDVQFAVLAYQPGDEIALTILRQGEQRQVTVVARRKDTVAATGGANGDLLKNLGLLLETADEGVMVTGVAAGSAAGAAGIQRGDIIREVNRTKVDSVDAVTAALDKTRNGVALFYIERRGEKMFVTVNVSAEER
jgi:S1-C subfamily serine protease